MNNIIHFLSEDISLKEINSLMKTKNEQYFSVLFNEKNELHIVKHDKGYFKINEMITELFNFYEKNNILANKLSIKGNDNFTIIYNINNPELINRIKTDLNTLLKK